MVNFFYDCYVILNKVYGEKKFVKQAINDTFIDESDRALTVKICYGVLDRDVELSYYIKTLAGKTPKLAIRTILKISMYMIKHLGKKDYFVVQNAVELTKKLGKGGASGFVNAFLRKFSTCRVDLPTDEIQALSVKYSYPEFAVKELINDYGRDRAERILGADYPDNTLCFYETNGKEYLQKHWVEFYETPFDNVFIVKKFNRNSDYDDGVYTYQSLGSVAICDIVDKCERLLDCCAAPGGKSVRLSYKVNSVISWDVHPHRVKLIEEYVSRMKRTNVFAETRNAKIYCKDFESSFDAVLCDAPCSGFGVVNDNPDIKLNRTEADLKALVKEQKTILDTVCRYVKKGGYLYYSTCSVFLCENFGVVRSFLKDHDNFVIKKIDSRLEHFNLDGTVAFLPDVSLGNGFYAAKLKRVK